MSGDLPAFLLARFAEDEAEARKHAARGDLAICADTGEPDPNGWSYVDTYDPARVLADVEAKRRIVEAAEQFGTWEGSMGEAALLALALPYASHPDYREEWKL